MLDNNLIRLLRGRMEAGIVAAGWTDMLVIQKDQPTQQGIPYNRSAFFQYLFSRKYGWASGKTTSKTPTAEIFYAEEDQLYETTFQISALAIQDPSDSTQPTASDVVNHLAMWMNHYVTVSELMKSNVNVLRVTTVRNLPFEDDRHRMEYHPSFDIVMTHSRSLIIEIPGALVNDNPNVVVIGKDTPMVAPPVHGIVGGV